MACRQKKKKKRAHVRSQIEWCNGAMFHAAPSLLERLDSVQTSFLRQLDLDERQTFRDHNLDPFKLRRDIRIRIL